jgi:hypothetical protein
MSSFLNKNAEKWEEIMNLFYHSGFLINLKKPWDFLLFCKVTGRPFGVKSLLLSIFGGCLKDYTTVWTSKLWITRDYLWISAFGCGQVENRVKISPNPYPQI